ncbi:MAG: DUF4245 domain-containing protein [Actinomycetia bacterium]|nr:DUF4245 domain-containing protein [Actinomycetes bacterium]
MSAPPQAPPRKRQRGFETIRDMVLSMSVVGAVVVGVFWTVAWQRPEVQGPVRPMVDVEQVFTDVRLGDTFPVLEPVDLPESWTATSAWFDTAEVSGAIGGGVLHVGYLTPGGSYAEVRQTDGDAEAAIDEWVDGGVSVQEVAIADVVWRVVESAETGKQGLVLSDRGVTIVVTGKAEMDELALLAGSLR